MSKSAVFDRILIPPVLTEEMFEMKKDPTSMKLKRDGRVYHLKESFFIEYMDQPFWFLYDLSIYVKKECGDCIYFILEKDLTEDGKYYVYIGNTVNPYEEQYHQKMEIIIDDFSTDPRTNITHAIKMIEKMLNIQSVVLYGLNISEKEALSVMSIGGAIWKGDAKRIFQKTKSFEYGKKQYLPYAIATAIAIILFFAADRAIDSRLKKMDIENQQAITGLKRKATILDDQIVVTKKENENLKTHLDAIKMMKIYDGSER